jgi:hypothetical protein
MHDVVKRTGTLLDSTGDRCRPAEAAQGGGVISAVTLAGSFVAGMR